MSIDKEAFAQVVRAVEEMITLHGQMVDVTKKITAALRVINSKMKETDK